MKTIIMILSMLLSLNVNSQELKVNITSREKLKEFFENNFPEPKWSKEEEESFKAYISSITKDMNKDNIFVWKGDINGDNKPRIVFLNFKEINDKGINIDKIGIYKKKDNKFSEEIYIKRIKKGDKEFFIDYMNGNTDEYKAEDDRHDFGISKIENTGKLVLRGITYRRNEMLVGEYYYSKVTGDYSYVSDGGSLFLKPGENYKLWFEYNYPDNSDKWSKEAKAGFDRIIKREQWDLVHKGDLLRSGNPVYIAMKYMEGENDDGKKVIFLNKLKIMEYVNNKWEERVFIGDKGRMDGKEIEINYSGIPARYEDVIFTINKNKSEDELNIHLSSQGIQGEIRYYYNSKEFEFISASDFAGE
ncbi:MAG: hypothetical protein GX447_06540 [Elusimicrobia bacterium]|nr:hypothetical protein [Elusimicrobiota bacterium]